MRKGGLLSEKEKKINGWWIVENPYVESYKRSVEKQRDKRGEFDVYHCSACSKTWQKAYSGSIRSGFEILYYRDFPTYKLIRKECSKCQK